MKIEPKCLRFNNVLVSVESIMCSVISVLLVSVFQCFSKVLLMLTYISCERTYVYARVYNKIVICKVI